MVPSWSSSWRGCRPAWRSPRRPSTGTSPAGSSGMVGAQGHTTGAPIALRIENADHANQPSNPKPVRTPRPGHADLAGSIKYGLDDFRLIRERASARETAARVAAGAVARQLLLAFDATVT